MKEMYATALLAFLVGFIIGANLFKCRDEPTKQPTVQCTDGKLYDVSYDGNITIYEKRPFATCEER